MPLRVAFLGFSDFERDTLASSFRLAADRRPCYEPVQTLTDADYLVVDADDAPSVRLVAATERMHETLFVGARVPPRATAWMARPIDPQRVQRELDAIVAATALHAEGRPAAPDGALIHLLRRSPVVAPATPAPPAAPASAASPVPAAASRLRLGVPPPAPLPRPRALLVDDSEIALRFLQSRLQPWNLDVDCAASSGQALGLLTEHAYDFVFLDLELGPSSDLDGFGLCQNIKHSTSAVGTLVILVSAHHSELDRVRGALAGCDAYLGKPLDEGELTRLLQRHGLKRPVPQPAPARAAPG